MNKPKLTVEFAEQICADFRRSLLECIEKNEEPVIGMGMYLETGYFALMFSRIDPTNIADYQLIGPHSGLTRFPAAQT